jgi:hypothetical protein
LWALGEPFHALTCFADESRATGEGVGLKGFWQTAFLSVDYPGRPLAARTGPSLCPSSRTCGCGRR